MFTECIIREVIEILDLKSLKEVVVSEKGSKVLNGLEFKQETLSFFIPSEKDFYKLTSNPYATPVNNFEEKDKQHLAISTQYGMIHFYNKKVDIDNYCDWDTFSKTKLLVVEPLYYTTINKKDLVTTPTELAACGQHAMKNNNVYI